jgi:hypothetical protein
LTIGVVAGAVPTPLPAAAPPDVDVGLVVGVVIVDGVTAVPDAERASPRAETPDCGAVGPTVMALAGAGAVAEVAAVAVIAVIDPVAVEAAGVPVGVGMLAGELAGGVPVGVRMSEVAVVGAGFAVAAAVPVAAGVASEKLLEPSPPPV